MAGSVQRIVVQLDDVDEYEVATRLVDHHLWDTTRAKHRWSSPSDAPMTWLAFLAWAASRRLGKIPPDLTWEKFVDACVGVSPVDEDDVDVDPTQPVPGPG